MKKSLIALAVSGALIAPAAMADSNVTVYGVANVSVDSVSVNPKAAASYSNLKVSSNTSRLGFKGNEDLGDGLSAIWQIESLVRIDNSNNAAGATGDGIGSRNTFAGLSSASAGTVLLGRHDTPYNIATRKLDLFGDTTADNRSIMGGGRATGAALSTVGASFDGRQPDVIAYISPSLNGFTGAIAYVAGAETAVAGNVKGSAWSLAGLYGAGPFYGSLAYEVHDLGTAGSGTLATPAVANLAGLKEKAVKLGLSYAEGPLTVSFAYEKLSDNFNAAGANLLGHNAYYVGTKYAFGNDAVKLAATKAGSNSGAATGANQVSLGYDHGLSKRTTVYALYTNLKNDGSGIYSLSPNGTGAPAAAAATAGVKESVISFGLKHTF
ncbi:MAG: porin [Nitrosomonadales bacterium]|nr:porin [Nitrosomonadales bacterium]